MAGHNDNYRSIWWPSLSSKRLTPPPSLTLVPPLPTPEPAAPFASSPPSDPLLVAGLRRKQAAANPSHELSATNVPWQGSAPRELRAPTHSAQFVIDAVGTTVGHQVQPADQLFYYAA